MSSTRTSSAKSRRKQRVAPCTPEDSSEKSTANVVERSSEATDGMTSGKSGTDTKPTLRSNKIAPKAHPEAERPPDEGQTDGQNPLNNPLMRVLPATQTITQPRIMQTSLHQIADIRDLST